MVDKDDGAWKIVGAFNGREGREKFILTSFVGDGGGEDDDQS